MTHVRLRTRLAAATLVTLLAGSCAPTLLDAPSSSRTVVSDQQWSPEQSNWFHHVSQGTATFGIPYEWFMALPTPELGSFGRLAAPAYLVGFGFIPSPASLPGNPDGLPVGFARGAAQVDPRTGERLENPVTGKLMTEFGLTCAACHTGQITYQGTAMTVEGGAAMLDLGKLRTAVGLSILRTGVDPLVFHGFADRVLGADAPLAARLKLRAQFQKAVEGVAEQAGLDRGVADRSVEEGSGRLDALNRIGNEVFAMDMRDRRGRPNRANYAPTDAPVHFPHIWDVPWFAWAQYDGSIQQPMIRNAGEALGVRALVNLSNEGQPLYNSSIDFHALDAIEVALAGPYAPGHTPLTDRRFTGLTSPRWPDFLPAIDPAAAAKGAALYASVCSGCHLAAPNTPAFWDGTRWKAAEARPNAPRFLDLPIVLLDKIGTDPAQATGLATRKVSSPANLGLGTQDYGRALGNVVEKVASKWYAGQNPPIGPDEQRRMNGDRPNGIQAPLGYRTRPLNGIWATPPYLHNGSVPSLYALLSPVSQRPAAFWLGSREYDPVYAGYQSGPGPGRFKLDTAVPGNSNKGHEFSDRPGPGVIGRALAPEERLQLIEYLKTL